MSVSPGAALFELAGPPCDVLAELVEDADDLGNAGQDDENYANCNDPSPKTRRRDLERLL